MDKNHTIELLEEMVEILLQSVSTSREVIKEQAEYNLFKKWQREKEKNHVKEKKSR